MQKRIILLFTLLFGIILIVFINFSGQSSEPQYLVYDRECNEFGPYSIDEYEKKIGDGSVYLGYCILDVYASTTTTWYKNDNILNNEGSINTFSCQINFNNEPQKLNKKNEIIYIVGHAYGSPSGDNPDLHHNLTEYFEQQDSLKDSYIVLTGDFVRNNNTKDFKMVKTYLENNFKDYLISVGNHEVINENNEISINNFNSVFDKDLYFLEVKDILFIAANFSNPNWEPSDIQKEIINEKINKAESKYIFLFSHQIFWKKEVGGLIKPNTNALLDTSLKIDSLGWISKSRENIFIVISGDYGTLSSHNTSYCKLSNNRIFIANGLGGKDTDTILKISISDDFFHIEELSILNY